MPNWKLERDGKEMRKFDRRLEQVKERLYRKVADLQVRGAATADHLLYEEALKLPTQPLEPDAPCCKAGETYWAFTELQPDPSVRDVELFIAWRNQEGFVGEAVCLFEGRYAQGVDANHLEVKVPSELLVRGPVAVALECGAKAWHPGTGVNWSRTPEMVPEPASRRFGSLQLVARNENAWELYHTGLLLADLQRTQPASSLRGARILEAMSRCLDRVEWFADDARFDASLAPSLEILRPLMALHNSPTTPVLRIQGHSHIDVAWLWDVREVTRKCARTFSTVDALMKEYPRYRFLQTQPALYEIVQHRFPEIYARVRKRIAEGRWEPEGAMWVEADCNIPSGESLVRQLLVGKAYFQSEFGVESRVLWLPDVFGYSANLPQILRGCGVPWFCTSKIGWSDTNVFPFDTFRWVGIDGSEVLTHFIKKDYNGSLEPSKIAVAWDSVQQKELQDSLVYPIGHGDGGGGPDRKVLELAVRAEDLEGMPRLEWKNVAAHFADLELRREDWPVYVGELYLELHRGTLTSQARVKRANREGEKALRAVEMMHALWDSANYPADELLRAWKDLLLNQFHDIIPGSSIREVYVEAEARYAGMFARLESLHRGLWARLTAGGTVADGSGMVVGDVSTSGATLFNTLSWPREGVQVVHDVPDETAQRAWLDRAERLVRTQVLLDGSLAVEANVPSVGVQVLNVSGVASDVDASGSRSALRQGDLEVEVDNAPLCGPDWMDNGIVRLTWDERGKLVSILDRRQGRELLAAGRMGNDLTLYEDIPIYWDAWDVDRFYRWTGASLAGRLVELRAGPLATEALFEYIFGASRIRQTMRLRKGSARVDFVTEVEWRENHRLLRTHFPTGLNAHEARFEIQYGHVIRPAHDNTSWEQARFEVAGHKWIDISEAGFGASLLNDCKYAHDIKFGVLSTTLLRSPKAPDPLADMGSHTFTYALLLHDGGFAESETVREAYELNHPLEWIGGRLSIPEAEDGYFSLDVPDVILEVVKRAEDGRGLVLRLYEAKNRATRVRLAVRLPFASWCEADMLERPLGELQASAEVLELRFRPFEIKTLRLFDAGHME